MQPDEQSKLLTGDTKPFSTNEPPRLPHSARRPWKGIFLTYFLFFCGLLFFSHGIHRYVDYSIWDLIAVWTLSLLLFIPGAYFGMIIAAVELRVKGFSYEEYQELFN